MGKGTIVSHLGSGLYSVTLNRDRRRITTALTWIDTRLAEIVLALVDYEVAEIAAKASYDASIVAMNALIQEMRDHPDQYATLEPQLIGATKDSLIKQATWQGWIYALRSTRLEQTSLQKRKTSLEGADLTDPVVVAWCADLSEDLSGVVATAEIPGERGTVQVRPGYGTGEVFSASRDGQLQPVEAGTAASAFWNCAILPGWQKWKPTYRHGTITAKSGDTCSVTLEAAASSAQEININQTGTLVNVPIEYMTCHGDAFTIGDKVLVQFTGQDWSAPKVIGFKESPKKCPDEGEHHYNPSYSWLVVGYFPRIGYLPKDCRCLAYWKPWDVGDNNDPADITGAIVRTYGGAIGWYGYDLPGDYIFNSENITFDMDLSWILQREFPLWPYYDYGGGEVSMFVPFPGMQDNWIGGKSSDWFGYAVYRYRSDYQQPSDWWRGVPESDVFGKFGLGGRGWVGYIKEPCGIEAPHTHVYHGLELEQIQTDDWPEQWSYPYLEADIVTIYLYLPYVTRVTGLSPSGNPFDYLYEQHSATEQHFPH